LPAAELLRWAALRINAAALLRRLYAAPLLRWLCQCPIETAPVWIYNSALLRRRYGWISIGTMGPLRPEIQFPPGPPMSLLPLWVADRRRIWAEQRAHHRWSRKPHPRDLALCGVPESFGCELPCLLVLDLGRQRQHVFRGVLKGSERLAVWRLDQLGKARKSASAPLCDLVCLFHDLETAISRLYPLGGADSVGLVHD
jgi:hypothetical protein